MLRELFRSRVVRTWRKAALVDQKPVAALAEPEIMEFEETHQSMGDMRVPAPVRNQDDDCNDGEPLQQQTPQQIIPESVPVRHRVTAQKTAATDECPRPSKLQGQSGTRTTGPQPLYIGIQTNIPVKKNKGYLKN